jgi:AraC-like DNA-binding protein
MTKTVIDTAGFPERANKLRRWREAVSEDALPVSIVAHGVLPPEGRMTTQSLGQLLFVVIEAEPQRFIRSVRRIGQGPGRTPGYVAAGVVGSAGGLLRQGRTTLQLRGEDVVLWDTERPHEFDFPHGVRMKACLIPRGALGPWTEAFERSTPLVANADSPSAAALGPLVSTLAGVAAHCPEHVARQLAGGVVDLVAALVAEHTDGTTPGGVGPRHVLVHEIRAYVDRNLMDANLSPKSIAAAHHMSVRSLHKLFEGEGITVSRLIQRRRLEECARDLLRAGGAQPTIASVARSWGFANPAHFSRLFRSVYGVTPSRWRADHAGQPGPGDQPGIPDANGDGPGPAAPEERADLGRHPRWIIRRPDVGDVPSAVLRSDGASRGGRCSP